MPSSCSYYSCVAHAARAFFLVVSTGSGLNDVNTLIQNHCNGLSRRQQVRFQRGATNILPAYAVSSCLLWGDILSSEERSLHFGPSDMALVFACRRKVGFSKRQGVMLPTMLRHRKTIQCILVRSPTQLLQGLHTHLGAGLG